MYQCDGGVEVVKASDPTQPAIEIYHTPQRAVAMFADLPYLYVTWCAADTLAGMNAGGGGLKILDSSGKNTLVEVGSIETSCAQGVTLAGNYAYLATWGGLVVVDISQPTRPIQLGVHTDKGFPTQLVVSGGMAYVLWEAPCIIASSPPDCNLSLRILDVSNPGSITEVGFYDLAEISIQGEVRSRRMALVDGYLYIPIWHDTWQVLRLTEAGGQ